MKSIRKASPELDKQVKQANFEIASQFVEKAQGKASGVGRQAAKASASLRASKSVNSAALIGGARTAFFYGAEFGSKRYGQFKEWRGNASADPFSGGAGYFVYPTIRENKALVEEDYVDAIMKSVQDAFN